MSTGSTDRADGHFGGVRLLASPSEGRYPDANTLIVSGSEATMLVDPSLELHRRLGPDVPVDVVLLTHAHEDHVAGLHLLREVPVLAHRAEAASVASPEALLDGYGLEPPQRDRFRTALEDDFHVVGRPDVGVFEDGHVVDLGGRSIHVVHLPGHTPGHCGFLVEPDGFMFLGDIDLTGFGPYYGDRDSSLDDFERSLERCRDVDARWYGTSHHRGVVEGRDAFEKLLTSYTAVIARRTERLLELLAQPRTVDDVAAHRLVYRPHVQAPFVEAVERRTAALHLERLEREGTVARHGAHYQRAG